MCWLEDGNEGIDNKAGAQYNNDSATKGQKGGNSMRKIFALVLVLTLLAVPLYTAVATGMDLSGMTDEDLTALKQQLDTEMLERGMAMSAALPTGKYTIGVDLPEGEYELTNETNSAGSAYYLYKNSDDFENGVDTGANWPLYMGDSIKIELTAGQILQIVFGPLRINTFAIQWQ